jgi:hypothetical protein
MGLIGMAPAEPDLWATVTKTKMAEARCMTTSPDHLPRFFSALGECPRDLME